MYRVLASHAPRAVAPQVAAALRSPLYLPYISALSPRWPLPSDLGLVYVDDTAWDASTTEQMAARLGRELPEGALVIHNGGEAAYAKARRLRKLHSVAVRTSWSEAHEILIHVVTSDP